ncbi:MAG: hypothetical protein OJF55_000581 [Rhodanobacteraceae bacterium]|jgi:uncharacterized DUF497 family protein|nr:MAG: hypothetical protein OJF55_000581 [Rhodanobacteraceae bacterium]
MAYTVPVRYEWDEAKRAANLAKHGVDFTDAVGALEDPHGRTIEDADASGETRYVTMGMGFSSRVLLVVWTERSADVIRVISARRASRAEARHYPEN